MIALPPPGESIPLENTQNSDNNNKNSTNDNQIKDATKEDKPVQKSLGRNADPLFGHLGVKKHQRKRKQKKTVDQLAKERNEQNIKEALIQDTACYFCKLGRI